MTIPTAPLSPPQTITVNDIVSGFESTHQVSHNIMLQNIQIRAVLYFMIPLGHLANNFIYC